MGVGNNSNMGAGNNLNMGVGNNLNMGVGNKKSYYRPSRGQNSLTRNIDNNPAWMNKLNAKKDEGPKRSKLFVLYGSVLTTSPLPKLRQMPLFLDNCLPTAIIRFGDNSEDKISFTCYLDSCAAMNTANLLLHQDNSYISLYCLEL